MENELGYNTSTKELYIGQSGTTPYVLVSPPSTIPISRGGTGQTSRANALKALLHVGTSTNLTSSIELGKYVWASSATNTPVASSTGAVLNIISDGNSWNKSSNSIWQLAFTTSDETPWIRKAVTSGSFSEWCAILTKTNFLSYITGEQIFNSLSANSSTPTDSDSYVVGGKTTTHAKLWEYVKSKTDSVYFRKGTDSVTLTIAGSAKTFNGSSNLSWSLSDIGAMSAQSFTTGSILLGDSSTTFSELRGTGALFASTTGSPSFGTLPLNLGGTGATTATAALTNLGVFYADTLPSTGVDGQICLVPES